MYFVKIRESIMIAHSLKNSFFGEAQNLHGATYIVDVTFKSRILNTFNVVIDIGEAHKITKEVLTKLNYKNLDDMSQFKNTYSTTEFLSNYIQKKIREKLKSNFSGTINVTLGETHNSWAGFEEE